MSFSDEHSARCLRYGQAQRGRRLDAPGWQSAPAPKRAEGTLPPGALPLRATDDKPSGADTRSLAAQRDFLVSENTRSKNHLRNILLESCLELEARPSDAQPPGNALRAVVDSRQRVQIESPTARYRRCWCPTRPADTCSLCGG